MLGVFASEVLEGIHFGELMLRRRKALFITSIDDFRKELRCFSEAFLNEMNGNLSG
jgi:hypothetical protein